ncbi:VC0807 family protein [Arthrobacter sp. MYb227]|uniref:VC0807 family protein n=1 Tax=Arthrobacter sp. MYb227 TaxID=1848601 RepID=UPI0011B02803|nr:VC0807 family protein [Arthrobacter sp. MYb227]
MPQHPDSTGQSAPRSTKPRWLAALLFLAAIALPPALYYVLRAFGLSIYLSLVIVAVATGVPAIWSLVRRRTGASIITTYFSLVSLAATLLAFIPGSPQFLMARDAAITAGTGAWFIYSIRTERPIVYTFTRPLIEGRMHWPGNWEVHWKAAPRFRRMWRISTVVWGLGFFLDAGLRSFFAYTINPDIVPALTTAMYLGTNIALIIISNIFYISSGIFNPHSALFATESG